MIRNLLCFALRSPRCFFGDWQSKITLNMSRVVNSLIQGKTLSIWEMSTAEDSKKWTRSWKSTLATGSGQKSKVSNIKQPRREHERHGALSFRVYWCRPVSLKSSRSSRARAYIPRSEPAYVLIWCRNGRFPRLRSSQEVRTPIADA